MSSKHIKQEPPKRPQTTYFKFRSEKVALYKGKPGFRQLIKADWERMDQKIKESMDKEYQAGMNQWKQKMAVWEKKHGPAEKPKESPQKRDPKPEREKGGRKKSEPKVEEKEKREKSLPSKGNGKKQENGKSKK